MARSRARGSEFGFIICWARSWGLSERRGCKHGRLADFLPGSVRFGLSRLAWRRPAAAQYGGQFMQYTNMSGPLFAYRLGC